MRGGGGTAEQASCAYTSRNITMIIPIGGVCSIYGIVEKLIHNFGHKTMKERDYGEVLGIDERIILGQMLRKLRARRCNGFI